MIDWRHWHNEPFLTGGLILAGWLYAILAGPLRARLAPGQPYPGLRAASFFGALFLFYLAVGSPLDQVGERFLLSAHMVQHLLILYPVPLLMIFGTPDWMIDPLLSRPRWRKPFGILLNPWTCALASTLVVSLWHMPALYEWTLRDKLAHVAEHLLFLAVSLLYWWPMVSPSKVFPVSGFGVRALYIIGTEIGMIPVSAYIVFSHDVLYPTYEYAPRLIAGLNPADDQRLAGIIMKAAGVAVSFTMLAICFFQWSKAAEKHGPA